MISLQTLRNRLNRWSHVLRDERGLSTVEYVILLVLIAAVAMGTWQAFGSMIKGKLDNTTSAYDETVSFE